MVSGNLTGDVTGNVSGSAATVTQAAQTAITSVGTLTALTVDDVSIDGNIISSGTGQDLSITPATDQKIVLDGAINVDAGVVTGATSITSTAFVGNVTGDVTGNVTGNVTGDVTGNADTSTTLAATKNIAGVAFDGSGNIDIPIGNLSDVTISSASDNQVLTYSSGSWINADASSSVSNKTYSAINHGHTATLAVNYHYSVDVDSGNATLTLPAIGASNSGDEITVRLQKNYDDGWSQEVPYTITLNTTGSDTIEGASTYVLQQLSEVVTLVSNGTSNWESINQVKNVYSKIPVHIDNNTSGWTLSSNSYAQKNDRYDCETNTHYIYQELATTYPIVGVSLPMCNGNLTNRSSVGDIVIIENASLNTIRVYGSQSTTGYNIETSSRLDSDTGSSFIDVPSSTTATFRALNTSTSSGVQNKWYASFSSNAAIQVPGTDTASSNYEKSALVWKDDNSTYGGSFEPQGTTSNELKIMGTSSDGSGKLTLNCENNSHGVSVLGPPHSAEATYDMTLPSALGTAGQFLKIDSVSGGSAATLSWDTVSATDITKTSGNITIDAQGDDTDIIFKGTDGGTDTTFLTLDGSDAGTAIFNHDINLSSDEASIRFGADDDVQLVHMHNDGLQLRFNSGSNEGPNDPVLQILTLGAGNSLGGKLQFHYKGSDTNGDRVGEIDFAGRTSANTTANSYAKVGGYVVERTHATKAGKLLFQVFSNNAETEAISITGNASDTTVVTTVNKNIDIADHNGTTGLKLSGTLVTATAAELNVLDGVTAGTVTASKALVVDANKDLSSIRNLTVSGDITLDDGGSIKEAGGTAAITIDSLGEVTKIGQDTPSADQVLTWDGSANKVVWSDASGGSATIPLVTVVTASTSAAFASSGSNGDNERIYIVNNDSTAVDITLPALSGLSGKKMQIKRLGSANVTVKVQSGEKLENTADGTFVLAAANSSVTCIANATGTVDSWYIF